MPLERDTSCKTDRTIKGKQIVVGGRISRYGTVRIGYVNDPRLKDDLGLGSLLYYSDELVGKGHFKARLTDDKTLEVLDGKKVILALKLKEMSVVNISFSGRFEVMAGGWLCEAWTHWYRDANWDKNNILRGRKMAVILRRAEKGIEPPYFDESFFIKVDPSLRRKVVVFIAFHPFGIDHNEKYCRAFDSKGNLIPFQIRFPLSRKAFS